MDKEKVTLLGYEARIPMLTKELFETEPESYEAVVLLIRANELKKNHAKMTGRHKPNARGTKMVFNLLRSFDKVLEEAETINKGFVGLGLPEMLEVREKE